MPRFDSTISMDSRPPSPTEPPSHREPIVVTTRSTQGHEVHTRPASHVGPWYIAESARRTIDHGQVSRLCDRRDRIEDHDELVTAHPGRQVAVPETRPE